MHKELVAEAAVVTEVRVTFLEEPVAQLRLGPLDSKNQEGVFVPRKR